MAKVAKKVVSLELKTDRPIRLLKVKEVWQEVMNEKFAGVNKVEQVTAFLVK